MLTNNKTFSRLFYKYVVKNFLQLSFKASHISFGGKVALFGSFVCGVSLFLPWVSSNDTILIAGENKITSVTSFSSLMGIAGVFIILCLLIAVFAVSSIQQKKRLKALSSIHLQGHVTAFITSIIIFLICIHSIALISGLQKFSVNIVYGRGIMLCITGSIIMLISSLVLRKEEEKNVGSHIHEGRSVLDTPQDKKIKDNMKLPF